MRPVERIFETHGADSPPSTGVRSPQYGGLTSPHGAKHLSAADLNCGSATLLRHQLRAAALANNSRESLSRSKSHQFSMKKRGTCGAGSRESMVTSSRYVITQIHDKYVYDTCITYTHYVTHLHTSLSLTHTSLTLTYTTYTYSV